MRCPREVPHLRTNCGGDHRVEDHVDHMWPTGLVRRERDQQIGQRHPLTCSVKMYSAQTSKWTSTGAGGRGSNPRVVRFEVAAEGEDDVRSVGVELARGRDPSAKCSSA
jgi:hypothetical protein